MSRSVIQTSNRIKVNCEKRVKRSNTQFTEDEIIHFGKKSCEASEQQPNFTS